MKKIIKQTKDYTVYKYREVYRVHFKNDESSTTKIEEMKSFITKNYDKVKSFL